MPFACIFVPDFPVEALLRAEPELRLQAVAVLEGKTPLQKILAVNEKARRAGASEGMTKLQVEACPDLVLRARSPMQEAAAHAALLDCAQSFSPRVEETADDTVLLDLAGLETLFGPPPKIARDLARRAGDFGLEANVAVASNPDAAALAAHGFSGVTVIPDGKEAELLGSLPPEALFTLEHDAAAKTGHESSPILKTLESWGIRNLRALEALPDVALSERLGQEGLRLQQLARGQSSRSLVPVDAPLIFEESVELDYPLVLLEPLVFLLNRLLEQLCARLGARALATQELRLQLELENRAIPSWGNAAYDDRIFFRRTLRLPVPLLDAKVFLKLMQLDLNANPPGAPIVKIHLAAEPVRPRLAQNGLFLPPSPEPEKLEITLARIAGIVGRDKIGSVKMLDTYRPEGFHLQRFSPPEQHIARQTPRRLKQTLRNDLRPEAGALQEDCRSSAEGAAVAALRILRPPVRTTVILREGRPMRVACPKCPEMCGDILWAAGPWRSSGDWWEPQAWARDEWDIAVQTSSGIALYRLVRDLLGGQWMLEGTYD